MSQLTPVTLCAAAIVWLLLVPPLAGKLLALLKLKRTNFQGRDIPAGYGIVILFWAAPVLLYSARFDGARRSDLLAFATAVAGFGLLGFLDDLLGDRSVTGLKGHIRKFFIDGEITTGFVKATGGAAIGIAIPRLLLDHDWVRSIIEGAIIALSANVVNLLDLRPGRACAAFLVTASGLMLLEWLPDRARIPALAILAIPTLVVYERDARARAMLGDTGSNLLGAALGVALVLAISSIGAQLSLLAALMLFHVVAERVSISALIERNRVLRTLDSLTGKR